MKFYENVIFPKFYDLLLDHKVFNEKRRESISKAKGRVLEVGVGTGLNLSYYSSDVSELVAVDPNPGMEKQFLKKAKDFAFITRFVLTGAESMPFDDNTFDSVVSTLALCSIGKLQEALTEVKRVLKPEGQFIFLDHGLSFDPSVQRWQRFLNPIQGCVGAGCSLTVNIEKELLEAGFQISELSNEYAEFAPKFLGYLYQGVAKK